MRRWITGAVLSGMLTCLIVGAASAATQNDAAAALFNRAEAFYAQGADGQALAQFRSYVLRHYNAPQIDEAYLYIARIFHRQKRCGDALTYLNRIPEANRTAASRLIEGVCQVEQEQAEPGLKTLRGLFKANFSPTDEGLFYQTLFRAERDQGRLLPAIAFAWRSLKTPAPSDQLLADVHQLLDTQLTDDELTEVRYMFAESAIGQDAALQLARRALARQDEVTARGWLDRVLNSPVPFPYRNRAEALMSRFGGADPYVQRNVLGVLLPLSGRYAAFGELVKRGMDLALKIHNETQPPVQLIYKDTQADPTITQRQLAVLGNEERVMAVLGPLTGAAAMAAAEKAEANAIPLLTLSQKGGVPQKGAFVFRNSLTAALQAKALARYAVQEQGLRSFGILHPDNTFGREFSYLFAREVSRLGGLVVATESYAKKDTDFRRPIKQLIGQDPNQKKDKPLKLSKQQELEDLFEPEELKFPQVPFDALFIPDYADKIGLIAPQLAFYGLEDTPLLGINGWNSPDLVRLAGKHVRGATFVDGFFRYSTLPFVKEFVDQYFAAYKEEPSILEAQAFDAAGILLYLLSQPQITSRFDLQQALANLQNYPGVTGATSFGPDGEADKVLFLLQVKKGAIVQVN